MNHQEYIEEIAEQCHKEELKYLDANDEFEFTCDQCGKCCRRLF